MLKCGTIFSIAMTICIALSGCNKNDAKAPQEGAAGIRAALFAGNYGDAAALARKQVTATPRDPAVQYELARAEALTGNRGKALDALELAMKGGLADGGHALDDRAFDTIRDDPRFAALVNRASPASNNGPADAALAAGSGNTRVEIREGANGTHIQAGDVKLDTNF
jgi:hypothetical protein